MARQTLPRNCPTCASPDPRRHPAVQFEGEVQICPDKWHGGVCTCVVASTVPSAAHDPSCPLSTAPISLAGIPIVLKVVETKGPALSREEPTMDLAINPARDFDKLELTRICAVYGLRQVEQWIANLRAIGGYRE